VLVQLISGIMLSPERMSKFFRPEHSLKRLADNSFKAIEEGAYETKHSFSHDALSLKKAILSCPHTPLITEVKFSSPSVGKIRSKVSPPEIAETMAKSGASALSVLTQPYLFEGSIEYLANIRKRVNIPILMKDIIVSRIQIDAGKRVGADCILLIKNVFDQNLAEENMESLTEYAIKRGLHVLVEVHAEPEYKDALKSRYELVGINNRDLETLQVDITNTEKLISRHGKGKSIIITESGISKASDIQYLRKVGADAFLVGTSIMATEDIASKVKELYGAL
jgi:indole-3-glycerol phosphate synthase